MATYTGNLNLKKPSLDDDALITDINNNMDILDTAANGIQDALAIVANGDTHVAITAGQYVYVRKHNTLAEGLYVASSNIAANAALSSSNLTADSKGGMNAISEKIGTVPSGQTVEGQISSLSDQIANLGTVLWTNSSPTSDFPEGDISVSNITKWHIVLIQFMEYKSATEQYSTTIVVKVGMKGELLFPLGNGINFRTFVTYTNADKIWFGQGGKGGVGFDNQYCVPIKIVGIV